MLAVESECDDPNRLGDGFPAPMLAVGNGDPNIPKPPFETLSEELEGVPNAGEENNPVPEELEEENNPPPGELEEVPAGAKEKSPAPEELGEGPAGTKENKLLGRVASFP